MTYEAAQRALALIAIVPAAATLYFFVFWSSFEYWRRHAVQTYVLMLGTIGGVAVAVYRWRERVLSIGVEVPAIVQVLGWGLAAGATIFGTIADRQIGIRVRSFMPFFEEHGRIQLQTSGAYGVVRHPIYAAGIWFQVGAVLVTGYVAVAVACVVLTLGALWFTRQEESRLVALLGDVAEYDRYREKVPALFPSLRRRRET